MWPDMRIEQAQFFLYGSLLFVLALGIAFTISSVRLKTHLRAVGFALGLGVIVVPGHGEFVMAPVLAAFVPPLRSPLVAMGGVFFLIWWAAAFGLLKRLQRL